MITVADVIAFRLRTEMFVRQVSEGILPTEFGDFRVVAFENTLDHENHIALIKGTIREDEPALVRVHSQSTLGDVFHSLRSDSGEQLRAALRFIERAGSGAFVYLRSEGQGIGLVNEIRSCALQDEAADALPAEETVGSEADLRLYGVGAQILRALGVRKIRLLTNHPRKIIGLQGYGIEVLERIPLEYEPTGRPENAVRARKRHP